MRLVIWLLLVSFVVYCNSHLPGEELTSDLFRDDLIPYLSDYVLLTTTIEKDDRSPRETPSHETRKCMKLSVRTKCAKYKLCLRPASVTRAHMFTLDGKVYVHGKTMNSTVTYDLRKFSDSLVEGFAEDHVDSSVSGYIHEERFYGRIYADGESYIIEPLGTFYHVQGRLPTSETPPPNAILYREVDMLVPPDYYRTAIDYIDNKSSKKKPPVSEYNKDANTLVSDTFRSPSRFTDAMFGPSNVFFHKRNYALICSLAIVADERFFNRVGRNDTLLTIKIMAYLIKEADYHFRAMDFNGDGRPDNIGFKISEMRLYTNPDNPMNFLRGEHTLADDYLWELARYDFDHVCLAIGFTHRVFTNQVQGKAWVATSPPDYRLGGICQKRSPIYGSKDVLNLNTVAVSLSNSYLKLIPTPMAVTVLLHELGHSFGSAHDDSRNITCHPGKESALGNYIMAPTSNDGRTYNNWVYSPCSVRAISRVLETKSSCFIPSFDPYCGNGMVEPGEECDCGTRMKCEHKQKCCGTPFSPFACRFRRDILDCPMEEPRMTPPDVDKDQQKVNNGAAKRAAKKPSYRLLLVIGAFMAQDIVQAIYSALFV